MAAVFAFSFVICSFCFFGSAVMGYRFERSFPVCSMGITAVLFAAGLLDLLRQGAALIVLAAAAALGASVYASVAEKKYKKALSGFLTPGFALFILSSLACVIIYRGVCAWMIDEFSHWMLTVKAMAATDRFSTGPDSLVSFQSYPPGMALFQYFFIKLDMWLSGSGRLSEWLCYYAYQLLSLSLIFPLFERLTFKGAAKGAFWLFLYFLSPMMYYNFIYSCTVLIDPFIGCAAGAGFLVLLADAGENKPNGVYFTLLCVLLTLSKDVGMLAAVFIGGAYLALHIIRTGVKRLRSDPKSAISGAVPLAGAVAARLLWKLELSVSGASIRFGDKVGYLHYIKMFFFGGDQTYRQTVADSYKKALFSESVFSVGISFSPLGGFLFLALAATAALLALRAAGKKIKTAAAVSAALSLYSFLYIFNLGAVYAYGFTEAEGLALASMDRYTGMALIPMLIYAVGIWLLAFDALLGLLYKKKDLRMTKKQSAAAFYIILALCAGLLTSKYTSYLFSGGLAEDSRYARASFLAVEDAAKKELTAGDRVYVVSTVNSLNANDRNYQGTILSYSLYPARIIIGEPTPETAPFEEWLENIAGNYDYVAVFRADDAFISEYGRAFAGEVRADSLYRVEKELGLLVPVD